MTSRYSNFLSSFIIIHLFKGLKKLYLYAILSTPQLSELGSRFLTRVSPQIRRQNRNGSKHSVKDLCRTGLCKKPRNSASLPCPFNLRLSSGKLSYCRTIWWAFGALMFLLGWGWGMGASWDSFTVYTLSSNLFRSKLYCILSNLLFIIFLSV
jgi:hypothetical protein